jgi:hypothetical protein
MEHKYILTEGEVIVLISNAFKEGYKSYNMWMGQPDTCYVNIEEDRIEYIEDILTKLDKNEK